MVETMQAQDVERLVVDYLADAVADENCTVGVGLPTDWTPQSVSHIEVANIEMAAAIWPIIVYSNVRLRVHAESTSAAKRLCGKAQGLLLGGQGSDGIATARLVSAPVAGRDEKTYFERADSVTRVGVRTVPVEEGS